MKFLKWLIKSLIIALVLIFMTNLIGRYININIPLNIITLLIVTILRVPGIIILTIFFLF